MQVSHLPRRRSALLRTAIRACTSQELPVYDVVIHGGGVVGAAVAADLLARTQGKCKVCLIEANSVRNITSIQPDPRVYALSPRTISLLERLDAWKHVEHRSHPYSSMQIWETTGPGLVKFRASDAKKTELGRICEDATIQAGLFKAISESNHDIDIFHNASIVEIKLPSTTNPASLAEVLLKKNSGGQETEQRITTRLLVAADGANSLVRRLTGIPSWGWGYGQEAVVCSVSLIDDEQRRVHAQTADSQQFAFENSTAWQRYLPTGPLALLPCWNGYSSIVWSVPIPEARRLKALSPQEFLAELNEALHSPAAQRPAVFESESHGDGFSSEHGHRHSRSRPLGIFPPWVEAVLDGPAAGLRRGSTEMLKGIGKELFAASDALLSMAQLRDPYASPPVVKAISGPRLSFPLNFQQSKYYALSRCALVGDAAHSIHPQAGQGLNLGVQDAAALVSHVVKAMESGKDIGASTVLQDFANERFAKNLAMMSIVDIINATFKDSLTLGDQVAAGNQLDANSPPVKVKRFLRSVGMLGINNSTMLKAAIAKFAMGTD